MRTTVDIADDQYADLKMLAARERTSVRALLSEMIAINIAPRVRRAEAGPFRFPVIGDPNGRKLDLSHDRVADLLMDDPTE